MDVKGNSIIWGLLIPAIVGVIAFWDAGTGVNPTLAQTASEPRTHTEKEFRKALQSRLPVLVDFGSNACVPCRQIRPILTEIGQEFSGKALVLVIDVYKFPALARSHLVQLIPTLIFFDSSGKEVFRHVGSWDKASIVEKLRQAGTEGRAPDPGRGR